MRTTDLVRSLERNHRVIETHLLDIDNYYRLSIINELKHSAGC